MSLQLTAMNRIVWRDLKNDFPQGTDLKSCYRSSKDQLTVLIEKARAHGYHFGKQPTVGDKESWSGALSAVRRAGVKIAAPGASNHERGFAYDLSGANLKQIEAAAQRLVDSGRIVLVPGSRSALLIEPQNNCVHIEIQAVLLKNDLSSSMSA